MNVFVLDIRFEHNGQAQVLYPVILQNEQAEALSDCLPEEQKAWALQFQQMLKAVKPVAVDATIDEEGELPFLRGVDAVFAPGHMPGHLSLFIGENKTLVAADAVVYENGELGIANHSFTLDLPKAVRSVEKLRQYAIEKMICYHGGVVTSGIRQGLESLVSNYTGQRQKQTV